MMSPKNTLNIICLETEAFFALIEEVVGRLSSEKDQPVLDKWISDDEAMNLLKIKSKTTLQKLRDNGAVRFTQPAKKLILYDRDSILEYLESHAKETF